MKDIKRVGIVGTGIGGLATAKTLIAAGLDCVLFERHDRLGGVWADGYSGFGVQAPKELFEFPDWPLPEDTPNFTPGPIFQQYLEDYVDHFGFRERIRFNTHVTRLERRADGTPGWTITTSGETGSQTEDFDLVVLATGLYSNVAHMPAFPGAAEYRGTILHNSELKDRSLLAGRRVAVIGYGKSANDSAMEAVAVAKEVHIILRAAHWPVPRKLAGILPVKWASLSRMASAFLPPYQRPTPVERWLHGIGKPLVWVFWRILELIIRVQLRLGTKIANGKNLIPSERIEFGLFGEASMLPPPEFYPLIRKGRITAHRTEVDRYMPDGVALKDGTELAVDRVVLATGWECDYAYMSDETRDALGEGEDGFYLYRHILPPALPNLAFIGRATTFVSVLTFCLQARWLAELINGRISLPSTSDMVREIDEMKVWKRSWMPFSSARGARLFLHAHHYHDELMVDMGADPLRKRGPFAPVKELFAPYEPRDYSAIVAGSWERPDQGAEPVDTSTEA
jgi:dimethylaniline monooxygenase (N-oxide forming)